LGSRRFKKIAYPHDFRNGRHVSKAERSSVEILSTLFERTLFVRAADWLVVGIALALPWSTSATGILIAVWLATSLLALQPDAVKRELLSLAGGLPVLLWALAATGMLWDDIDWRARLAGLGSFHKLLMIPLLIAQFRRSEHGYWVVLGFLISSAAVLAVSYFLIFAPGLTWRGHSYLPGVPMLGVPVHDYVYQSSAFLICGFGILGYLAFNNRQQRPFMVCGLVSLAALFFANFAFALISRISFAIAPVLAALLGWRRYRWKGLAATSALCVMVGVAVLFASPSLRARVNGAIDEMAEYRSTAAATPIGLHIAFLRGSLTIMSSAPIFGHGTGSIPTQFQRLTIGQSGATGVSTVNPHNQTFAVAIQLGLVGAIVLWAMWLAHFLLFRGTGVAAWFGAVVVAENIVSSTVHSHLFDFDQGWLYVFGVGVLAGMVLQKRDAAIGMIAPREDLRSSTPPIGT
jgi:O-antigen ligase